MATHSQYLTELIPGRNFSKLTSGYTFSHTFNPGEHSASTYVNGNTPVFTGARILSSDLSTLFIMEVPFSLLTCTMLFWISWCYNWELSKVTTNKKNLGKKNTEGVLFVFIKYAEKIFYFFSAWRHITKVTYFDLFFLIFLSIWIQQWKE